MEDIKGTLPCSHKYELTDCGSMHRTYRVPNQMGFQCEVGCGHILPPLNKKPLQLNLLTEEK